ncbi:M15 family metallopeptidase [Niallia sp. NCCP-28]|uniref:M15 family metallopeptidase n=1 Tax=Niallia sp. NCCP-28 TaxID=2934712 RepID=UPI00208D88EB|nr:M15 family metallopeptidase [Niallia sp. NCCP-28]GKU82771.1 peptidoglycan L-alanyl-D-glutamate endopeptidase CwlK [Niallia sp. NCCP-28]
MKKKRKRHGSTIMMFIIISVFLLVFWKQQQEKENELSKTPLPTALHETLAEKRDILLSQALDKGIHVVIVEGFRSVEEQNDLYNKGRTEEGNIVTHAKGGESYHNYGLAIDFALLNNSGATIWDMEYDGNGNGKSDWMEVVSIAKSLGFEWGGDWANFKDYPHLQMDFGLSIAELQKGQRP